MGRSIASALTAAWWSRHYAEVCRVRVRVRGRVRVRVRDRVRVRVRVSPSRLASQ